MESPNEPPDVKPSNAESTDVGRRPLWLIVVIVLLIIGIILLLLWWRQHRCPDTAREQREAAGIPADEALLHDQGDGYYLAGLVVGRDGPPVDTDAVELLDADDIDEALRCTSSDKSSGADSGSQLDEIVNVYRIVDPLDDPIVISRENPGLAPVYVVAPSVHWSFEPGGEDAQPFWSFLEADEGVGRNPLAGSAAATSTTDRIIAVVDTGYIETGIPPIDDFVIYDPDEDTDPGSGLGHGVHIASLIRQVAPNAEVSIARAEPGEFDDVLRPRNHGDETLSPNVPFTNELEVAAAIARLIDRHSTDEVAALNLSLGTWAEELTDDSPVRIALEAWWSSAPGAESRVFAAAGNENLAPDGLQFFPAALTLEVEGEGARYPQLTAVQPTDQDGNPVYWTETGQRATFDGQPWATAEMLGVDLLGVCGPTAETCVLAGAVNAAGETARFASWSGASFASPVVAAIAVNNERVTRQNRPQAVPDYADVPGLSYLPAP